MAESVIIGGTAGTTVTQTVTFLTGDSHANLDEALGITLISGGQQSDWDNVRLRAESHVYAQYSMDEVSWGTVVDSVNGFNSTAYNGAHTLGDIPAISGNPGTCRYGVFDGNDDYIALPDSFDNLQDSFTITAWIKPTNLNKGSVIFIDDENNTNGFGFSLGDPGRGKLRFYSRTVSPISVDTGAVINANVWTFVAAVHNSVTKTRKIYVNGVAQTITGGDKSNTYLGTWGADTGPAAIGGETDLGDTRNRFTGNMDEVRVYKNALTESQISAIYTETHACSEPVIHHYEISHDGEGLTCDTELFTVKACTNESCSNLTTESVTLDFLADGALNSSETFTGSTIVSVNHTVVETLTFALANTSLTASNPLVCDNGVGSSCDMAFTNAGFRFLSGTGNSTTLPNETAGTVFGDTLKIQAVKDIDGVCTGVFSGNTVVNLSQENVDPAGTSGLNFSVSGSNIAKQGSVPSTTSTTLNFGANSIATLPSPIYHDAGQIRLHANYDVGDVTLSGSSNAFWVSPAEFVVSAQLGATDLNGATANASTTYAAGESFDLTLSAKNSLGVITPNYSPGQIQFKLNRTGPTLTDSVDGNLTYGAASTLTTSTSPVFQDVELTTFASGISTYNAAQYSEVGLLNLAVQDSNYGNAGMVIPATAIDIGRFIPEHFTQTVAEDGYFVATCDTGTTFAYSGQKDEATDSIGAISYLTNPILAITAYNKQGNITQNYYEDSQGSVNDFMKLSSADINITEPTFDEVAVGVDSNKLPLTANMNTGTLSQDDLTTLVPADNPLPKGVLHYQLSDEDNFFYNRSANALVAPFTANIDFSTATITDADNVNLSTTVAASPSGVDIRFGRLILRNSFGPETSNLPQVMQIEHFDGTGFVVSDNNNCVGFDASKISLTNISLDPALTNVLGGTGNFVSGKTQEIELAAPSAENQGQIGVSYDAYDWLKYDWDSDNVYDDIPSATATFGLYRGNDRIIYSREIF